MNEYVRDKIEKLLDGSLNDDERSQVQELLENDPNTAREIKELEETTEFFVDARAAAEESASFDMDPAFFARVMQSVEEERQAPFWVAFLEPLFVKRLAFAALAWLAMLGSFVAIYDKPDLGRNERMAQHYISGEPAGRHVHFGNNVNENRNSMMVVLAQHSE